MGVRIAYDEAVGVCCLYCSTSGTAFGPIFVNDGAALDFLSFLGNRDACDIREPELLRLHADWQAIYEKETQ